MPPSFPFCRAARADVLGFEPAFFYGPIDEGFREEECSFRHRKTTPERLKSQIRAHATLIGMMVQRLRTLFKFPDVDVPHIRASSAEEIETAAEECRKHWAPLAGPKPEKLALGLGVASLL